MFLRENVCLNENNNTNQNQNQIKNESQKQNNHKQFNKYNNQKKKKYKTLCIPKIDNSISLEYIQQKFIDFQISGIIYMKEIPLYNQENYKRILIKVSWDTNNNIIKKMEELIEKVGSVKLVYDMPWYWKLVYNGK
jgi:hypothetical protein